MRSPWIAVMVVLIGSYANALNTTVMGIALPSISVDLDTTGPISVDWVVTAFLLGLVVSQPAAAWVAARIGRLSLYLASLGLFLLGAMMCAVAPSIEVLVIGRSIQGIGGGSIIPVGLAIVADLFPPERRGTALGVWGLAIMAGPAAGPPVGAWFIETASWRWIFIMFAVIALVGAICSFLLLPETGVRRRAPFDAIGWVLASSVFVAIVLAARLSNSWGLTSRPTLILWAITGVGLAVLVRRCLGHPTPILQMRMFGIRNFSFTIGVVAASSLAHLSQITFLPLVLQVVLDLDVQQVGMLLIPGALATAATMPVAGWLSDRIGPKVPVLVGLALMVGGTWQMSRFSPSVSSQTILAASMMHGFGNGLVFVPTTVVSLISVPGRFVTDASVTNSLVRQLAGALGVALLSAILISQIGAVTPRQPEPALATAAYSTVFMVCAFCLAVAFVLGCFLPGRARVKVLQDLRRNEG